MVFDSSTFQLVIDPGQLNFNDNYVQGRAELIVETNQTMELIPIECFYWYEGDVFEADDYIEPSYWLVTGEMELPDQARNFDVFNYRDYLRGQGVIWSIKIQSIERKIPQIGIFASILRSKNFVLQKYKELDHHSWFAIFNKLILNSTSSLYNQYRDIYLSLGILHLFAISGFHIYLIRQILKYILLRIGLTHETTDKLLFCILILYGWLISWPIGMIRSFWMIYAYPWLKKHFIYLSQSDSLSIVAISLLFINPLLVHSLSFILSFLLSFVLMFYYKSQTSNTFWQSCKTSLLALSFTWPISLWHSHRFHLAQVISIPILSLLFEKIVMPLMLSSSIIPWVPDFIQSFILSNLNFIANIWLSLIESLNSYLIPINIAKLSEGWMILLFFVAIGMLKPSYKHTTKLKVFLAIYSWIILIRPYMNINYQLTIIDVGQGDAVLYQQPFNQGNWLIDTGGRTSINEDYQVDLNYAQRTIIPALYSQGINKLDGIVLSHLDIDHIGNLQSVLQSIKVDNIYVNQHEATQFWYQEVKLWSPRTAIHLLEPGIKYSLANNHIELMSLPQESIHYSNSKANDSSIGTHIRMNEWSYLSLGDIGTPYEAELVQLMGIDNVDIYKLSHHGSRHSSDLTLLKNLETKLFVNSAGSKNRYNHPHSEVVDMINQLAIPFLSTHEVGSINIQESIFGQKIIRTVIGK